MRIVRESIPHSVGGGTRGVGVGIDKERRFLPLVTHPQVRPQRAHPSATKNLRARTPLYEPVSQHDNMVFRSCSKQNTELEGAGEGWLRIQRTNVIRTRLFSLPMGANMQRLEVVRGRSEFLSHFSILQANPTQVACDVSPPHPAGRPPAEPLLVPPPCPPRAGARLHCGGPACSRDRGARCGLAGCRGSRVWRGGGQWVAARAVGEGQGGSAL